MSLPTAACPLCERPTAVSLAGRFYPHVPYAPKQRPDTTPSGIRCAASGKTPDVARALATTDPKVGT